MAGIKPYKNRPKGAQLDMLLRRREIVTDLIKGKNRATIQEDLKKKYQLSDETIRKDFKAAYERLAEWEEQHISNIVSEVMARYDLLWEKALEKDDLRTAVAILKEMAAITKEKPSNSLTIKEEDKEFEIKFS